DRATSEAEDEGFPDAELMLQAVSLLLPSELRDAFEAAPPESDALRGDFRYLSLRRVTQHDAAFDEPREARFEWLAALLIVEAIYKVLGQDWDQVAQRLPEVEALLPAAGGSRSEERRVGKECRSRWATCD